MARVQEALRLREQAERLEAARRLLDVEPADDWRWLRYLAEREAMDALVRALREGGEAHAVSGAGV
ncbi:MAG: hypothetical protein QJR08_03850 [Bacillota bacterium]|nr:hypothetical protein [Bacillota bacterium]